MSHRFLFASLLLASISAGAPPAGVSVLPYPPSAVITGVTFRDETARTLAPGSDIWPLTWAADGHQYTTFGDGGGFGGTGRDGRVSLGIARVEGGKDDYVGVNIAGGKNAPHAAPFTGKSEGILAIGDTLYFWRNGVGSDRAAFEFVRLYRSDDHGATWQDLPVEFSRKNGDFAGRIEETWAPVVGDDHAGDVEHHRTQPQSRFDHCLPKGADLALEWIAGDDTLFHMVELQR